MLPIVLVVLAVLIVGVLILAATKPDTFRIQRATTIKASPAKIFALIDDFHGWQAWSPWEKLDPGMIRTYSGESRGRGAVYAWKGNGKVGEGRMEITESDPSSMLVVKLDFIRPFEGHNVAEFELEPRDGFTEVRWAMHGPSNFVSKLFQVFVSMERMIGKDFEKGLSNLKAAAES